MVSRETYTLPVTIAIVILLFKMLTPLVYVVHSMEHKIVAYADCADEMIDKAFLGESLNFTECYLSKVKNKTNSEVICSFNNGTITCNFRNRTFVYEIELQGLKR